MHDQNGRVGVQQHLFRLAFVYQTVPKTSTRRDEHEEVVLMVECVFVQFAHQVVANHFFKNEGLVGTAVFEIDFKQHFFQLLARLIHFANVDEVHLGIEFLGKCGDLLDFFWVVALQVAGVKDAAEAAERRLRRNQQHGAVSVLTNGSADRAEKFGRHRAFARRAHHNQIVARGKFFQDTFWKTELYFRLDFHERRFFARPAWLVGGFFGLPFFAHLLRKRF